MVDVTGHNGLLPPNVLDFFRLVEPGIESGIQIYRQMNLMKDCMEYAIFFRKDGTKYRCDYDIKSEVLERVPHGQEEGYAMGQFAARLELGAYIKATEAVTDFKAVEID